MQTIKCTLPFFGEFPLIDTLSPYARPMRKLCENYAKAIRKHWNARTYLKIGWSRQELWFSLYTISTRASMLSYRSPALAGGPWKHPTDTDRLSLMRNLCENYAKRVRLSGVAAPGWHPGLGLATGLGSCGSKPCFVPCGWTGHNFNAPPAPLIAASSRLRPGDCTENKQDKQAHTYICM